jgi:hypothetical protein
MRINACGRYIVAITVEIVPPGADWEERERSWIRTLRFSFPDNCNTAAGGQSGLMGHQLTKKQRKKLSEAQRKSKRCTWAAFVRWDDERRKRQSPAYRMRMRKKKLKALKAKQLEQAAQ